MISLGCFLSHPKVALILEAKDDSSALPPSFLSLRSRTARLLAVSDSVEVDESVDVDVRCRLLADALRDGM